MITIIYTMPVKGFLRESQYWDQDQPGIINRADPYDHFGQSLTVGNFNGDINRDTYLSIDDLVIGVPGEDQGRVTADSIRIAKFNNAGALHVIYGDPTGLVVRPGTDQFFHQARADLGNAPSRYDDFAAALAAGDFNGDARDDLAVGVPLANVNGLPDAGLIQILFAGSTGISANDRVYHQDKPGIEDRAEAYDHYGAALAVGIPGEDLLRSGSIIYDSGAVNVMYGTGFDQFGIYDDQRLIQQARTRTRLDRAGNPESFDHFGRLFNDGRINDTLPILSSDPTATRHLYLDFNGHFQHEFGRCVTNNLGSDHCSRNVYTPPFDIDGDTTTFNRTEQELMLDIWLHVAEDFAPFNINVTTDASWFNDGTKPKPRVAIGGRSTDWYENEPSVSGVNRSGRNKDHFQNVVYVFSRSFFGGVYTDWDLAAAVGSTASHEAGHWYGLNHKGDYTPGRGRDEKYSRGGAGWSPIMGSSSGFKRQIWTESRVDPDATTREIRGSNDVRKLTRKIGARPDDHGDRQTAATSLGGVAPVAGRHVAIAKGLIGTRDDIDWFRFTVEQAGRYAIDLDVPDVGANLNSRLGLYDPGALLPFRGFDAPANDLYAALNVYLPAGEYFIAVNGMAEFTGDIGQYTLRVEAEVPLINFRPPGTTAPPITNPPPDLGKVDPFKGDLFTKSNSSESDDPKAPNAESKDDAGPPPPNFAAASNPPSAHRNFIVTILASAQSYLHRLPATDGGGDVLSITNIRTAQTPPPWLSAVSAPVLDEVQRS